MKKRSNIINYVATLAVTVATLFAVVLICNNRYGGRMIDAVIKLVVGALFAGIINAFAHELGHLIAGKKNGFVLSEITVWFFRWKRIGKKTKFSLVMIGDEAGYTEMIPTKKENVKIGFIKMTRGGIIASLVLTIFGLPPLFMPFLPVWVFVLWAMFLPMGAYYFFGNFLPVISMGARNDGAVLLSMKKNDDASKGTENLLKIQAELYHGKTPSEIDDELYFNLPQLPEDDMLFAMLLNARYAYFLDKEDFENAKKVLDRLLSLEEYLPKSFFTIVKTEALYSACTFDFDEEKADDLVYELEKFLNNVNVSLTVRAKLAYLLNVKRESDGLDIFFSKGYKEADKQQIKGLREFERKLLDRLKN